MTISVYPTFEMTNKGTRVLILMLSNESKITKGIRSSESHPFTRKVRDVKEHIVTRGEIRLQQQDEREKS